MEAIGDPQLGIQGEQQWQARGGPRIEVLAQAGQAPGTADALAGTALTGHHIVRHMVQKASQTLAAEGAVLAGIENELVPGQIHRLRGHGD